MPLTGHLSGLCGLLPPAKAPSEPLPIDIDAVLHGTIKTLVLFRSNA